MKRYPATQELVNIYPPESRIRNEQSVGFSLFNTFGKQLDNLEKDLIRTRSNQYLLTANLDEIDLLYKVVLPTTFDFEVDTSDPAIEAPVVPTVSGYIDGSWRTVSLAKMNSLKQMWYEALPDRISLGDTVTGVSHELLTFSTSGIVTEGEWDHYQDGGWLWLTTSGGNQYLTVEDSVLHRGRVTIHGTNRQGLEASETLIFPWDMSQHTQQEWKTIEKVEVFDMEDEVILRLKSGNFNATDRLDFWNTSYSENRRKIDEFWGLGHALSGMSLERIRFITDEWEQLILGFIDKYVEEAWELLDSNYQAVTAVDLALQPFTDRAWVVTSGGMLHCYSAYTDMVSGYASLRDRTAGTNVRIETDTKWLLLGEDINFTPWHARPLQEVRRYRVWYQEPGGTRYGLLTGAPVAWSSDFWVDGGDLQRTIADQMTLTPDQRGEYKIGLEVEFEDGTIHKDIIVISVNSKLPLVSFNISALIGDPILGIDFDTDQQLWVRTADTYYQLDFHMDNMLIDYENKVIYFREPYETVSVDTDG